MAEFYRKGITKITPLTRWLSTAAMASFCSVLIFFNKTGKKSIFIDKFDR